jgi:hypothetical protein
VVRLGGLGAEVPGSLGLGVCAGAGAAASAARLPVKSNTIRILDPP